MYSNIYDLLADISNYLPKALDRWSDTHNKYEDEHKWDHVVVGSPIWHTLEGDECFRRLQEIVVSTNHILEKRKKT